MVDAAMYSIDLITAVTFVEGPGSVVVVPTQTAILPKDDGNAGVSEIFVLRESCAVPPV